jgi:hypothetical protein
MPGKRPFGYAVAIGLLAALIGPTTAMATTICVPSFSAACPNSGGNVAKADVEEAMSFQGEDGIPDEVRIAAGTFTETGAFEPPSGNAPTFEPYGDDPLTIVGSGPAATILTSTGTGNIFLFNFSSANTRPATMRNLTARVPSTFTDDGGAAFQLDGTVLENVDIVSLNPGSDGVASAPNLGNVFRGGEVRGEGAGSVADGLGASNPDGSLLVEDATIRGASWALKSTGDGSQLTARRVREIDTRTYGVAVTGGGIATVESSVFTLDDAIGLFVSAADDDSTLDADHITVVNTGDSYPALEAKKFGAGAGDAAVSVSNSILRGFSSGYKAETAIGPGIGSVSIKARYSDLPASGSSINGSIDFTTGNLDVDPLLKADLSLPAGSPSIDAGDPATGGLASDYLGAPRPVDGNGDGVARRDQGAFEYQPPSQPPPPPPLPPTPQAPQTTILKGPGGKLALGKAKFSFKSSQSGSRFECKLDRRKAAKCKSPKRYTGLKPGSHLFKVWAVNSAGGKDPTPAKRRFAVPQ